MTKLDLEKELDEADPRQGDRRAPTSWVSRNWLPMAMLLLAVLPQFVNGGGWSHDRTNAEQTLATSVDALRADLRRDEATFVREDVFIQVLKRIDERLKDISDAQQQQQHEQRTR